LYRDVLYELRELLDARLTYAASLELGNLIRGRAKMTKGSVLGYYYLVSLDVKFHGIRVVYPDLTSHLLRDDYSAEFIDTSDHSCRFHSFSNPIREGATLSHHNLPDPKNILPYAVFIVK
jgi:hypothetical protein